MLILPLHWVLSSSSTAALRVKMNQSNPISLREMISPETEKVHCWPSVVVSAPLFSPFTRTRPQACARLLTNVELIHHGITNIKP